VSIHYRASMYHVEPHNTVGKPWTDLEPIRVGPVPTGCGTSGIYLTIERDGEPYARIDAWPLHGGPFVECIVWREYVVFGWGRSAHLINPLARDVRSIDSEIYFGHLYPLAEKLLVASESDLACLNAQRNVVWRSRRLGIDGVVVDHVAGDLIIGKGECDPPGGWQPFQLSLESGRPVAG
jgi:hypothetical protein